MIDEARSMDVIVGAFAARDVTLGTRLPWIVALLSAVGASSTLRGPRWRSRSSSPPRRR
jgi:hypothetical protein